MFSTQRARILGFIGLCVMVMVFQKFNVDMMGYWDKVAKITYLSTAVNVENATPVKKSYGPEYTAYIPSKSEAYIMGHMAQLGLTTTPHVDTCHIWTITNSTPYHRDMIQFNNETAAYYNKVKNFSLPFKDIRYHLNGEDVCQQLELHENGLPSLFPSGQLSYTRAGWVEPLLPQMRHPDMCLHGFLQNHMRLDYMVHDFGAMCRKLKPMSRTVFVDMGASLSFHGSQLSPPLFIMKLFGRFGMPFDHVYAFEIKRADPNNVINLVPDQFLSAYHWINVGVSADPTSKQNPFKLLKENFNKDDLIVVKLDIDTPDLEAALAEELRSDPELFEMVDHFYFEHHVNQAELIRSWGKFSDTVENSMKLFQEMRTKGIASHYWV